MDVGAGGRGNAEEPKTWALVLMGGGPRGLVHIGVISVLEENGLVPDIVTGTSMGAIVGGLFAAGLPAARLTVSSRLCSGFSSSLNGPLPGSG